MTNRYVPERQSDVNDLDLAKARLRVAAIQAAPTELIRRHPWSSVLGTFAAAVAISGLMGGRSKKVVTVEGKQEKVGSGFSLPPGFLHGVMGLGMQFAQTYLMKHAVQKGAEASEKAEADAARDAYAAEGSGHAVG